MTAHFKYAVPYMLLLLSLKYMTEIYKHFLCNILKWNNDRYGHWFYASEGKVSGSQKLRIMYSIFMWNGLIKYIVQAYVRTFFYFTLFCTWLSFFCLPIIIILTTFYKVLLVTSEKNTQMINQ